MVYVFTVFTPFHPRHQTYKNYCQVLSYLLSGDPRSPKSPDLRTDT